MTAPTAFIERIERGLDDATRAILDLAFVAPELTESAFDRILSTLAPGHGDAIRQIATDLLDALDLRTDPPTQVLARHGIRHATDALRVCDAMAEERETDAVRAAQLVASLVRPARTVGAA